MRRYQCRLAGLVNRAAAGYGLEDAGFGVLGWRDFAEVVGEDDEVGVFASFQLTLLPFLELGIGRAGGVRADAIF